MPFINRASSAPSLTSAGLKWFFRVGPTDQTFGEGMLGLLKQEAASQTIHRIAILHTNDTYGNGLDQVTKQLATQNGYIVVTDQAYDKTTTDLTPEILRIRDVRLDTNYLLFDVATDTRWPRFSAALMEHTPYRAVLSLQLPAEEAAALNLFANEPGTFTDSDVDTAAILAAHISTLVALHEAKHEATQLHTALHTSREIGAAIGVLMAHHKITEPAAFTLLRTASQSLHRKVRDIAADVVETGALPGQPSHPAALAAAQRPDDRNRHRQKPLLESGIQSTTADTSRPPATLTGPKQPQQCGATHAATPQTPNTHTDGHDALPTR